MPLFGITLDSNIYLDMAPSFSCWTSSLASARMTNAVVYLIMKQGFHALCYLDDFVGAEPDWITAERAYPSIIRITAELGLDLATVKCVSLATEIESQTFTAEYKL